MSSVTGLDQSIPFCVVPLAGVWLRYGVGARADTCWGWKRIGRPIYERVVAVPLAD